MRVRKNQTVATTDIEFYSQLYNNYSGLTDGEVFIDDYDNQRNLGIKSNSAITIYDNVYTENDLYNLCNWDYVPPQYDVLYGIQLYSTDYNDGAVYLTPPTSLLPSSIAGYTLHVNTIADIPQLQSSSWQNSSYRGIRDLATYFSFYGFGPYIMNNAVYFRGTRSYSTAFSTDYFKPGEVTFIIKENVCGVKIGNDEYVRTGLSPSTYNQGFLSYNGGILKSYQVYDNDRQSLFDEIICVYDKTSSTYGYFSKRTKQYTQATASGYSYVHRPVTDIQWIAADDSYWARTNSATDCTIYAAEKLQVKIYGSDTWTDGIAFRKAASNATRTQVMGNIFTGLSYYTENVGTSSNPDYDSYPYSIVNYVANGNTYTTTVLKVFKVSERQAEDGWERRYSTDVYLDYGNEEVYTKLTYYYIPIGTSTHTYPNSNYTKKGDLIVDQIAVDTGNYIYDIDIDHTIRKYNLCAVSWRNSSNDSYTTTDIHKKGTEVTNDIDGTLPTGYTEKNYITTGNPFALFSSIQGTGSIYMSAIFTTKSTSITPCRFIEGEGFYGRGNVHWAAESSNRMLITPWINSTGDSRIALVTPDNFWKGSTVKLEQLYNQAKATDMNDTSTVFKNGAAPGSYTRTVALYVGGGQYYSNKCYADWYGISVMLNGTIQGIFIPCTRDSDSKDGFYNVITNEFKS